MMIGSRRGVLSVAALLGMVPPTRPAAAPADQYQRRRAAAMERLDGRILIVPSQGAFKSDDQAGFQQTTDFQYLTGLGDLVGAVLVFDGKAKRTMLFVPGPSSVISRPRPTPESAPTLGLDAVVPIDSLAPWLTQRIGTGSAVLVAASDNRGTVRTPPPMAGGVSRWSEWLVTLGWKGPVEPALPLLRPLREIKDAGEIAILERVGTASGQAMLAGMRALRPGLRQRMAEAAVVSSCIRSGGRHSFWPWTMSGSHALFTDLFNSFVDAGNHDRAMQAGEVVRVDVGCMIDRYQGDVGRTAPVSGRFTPGQRESWDLFIAGYRAGLTGLKDGGKTSEVFRINLDRIRELAPKLKTAMGRKTAEILLGPGGTGAWEIHAVGLDDAEGMPEDLKAGMTVAYELMFMVDGFGFYLEDMILIEPNGYRLLTPGLPYTSAEIEAAMRAR